MDNLANALCKIINAEKIGKKGVVIRPASKEIRNVLDIMKHKGYIGDFKLENDYKGGAISVNLIGHLNETKVIKPRSSVKVNDIERYERRFLPAYDVGIIIISTSKGLMDHEKAKEAHLGGKMISYCY